MDSKFFGIHLGEFGNVGCKFTFICKAYDFTVDGVDYLVVIHALIFLKDENTTTLVDKVYLKEIMIDIIMQRTVEGTTFDLIVTGRRREVDRYTVKLAIIVNKKACIELQQTNTDLHEKSLVMNIRISVRVDNRIVIQN